MGPSNNPLSSKYEAASGRVYLSGTQALVRLLLMQRWRDRIAGLNTAGFVSGYRGSPLGAVDTELWRAKSLLTESNIVFQPGINEDLAATAIWGTQQVGLFPEARHDGVFSLWYGKGPGIDRSGDALKHANLAGTSPLGGVVVAFGDDHGAKSSTLAHQSEQALVAAMIPVLNPATIGDILEFGIFGWEMSRYSGLWIGLKCVNELVESSASIELSRLERHFTTPQDIEVPPGGVHVRLGHEPVETEHRLMNHKLPMAVAFARANRIDKVIWKGSRRRIGIVAAGKAYLDVRQAFLRLGIDEKRADHLGIGLYKIGMSWPLEPAGMKAFAAGYDELFFVEEKRSLIEDQAARLLYDSDATIRPNIVGKSDETGNMLLPSDGTLDPVQVAKALGLRLKKLGSIDDTLQVRLDEIARLLKPVKVADFGISRRPYFCSGCPHNRSTTLPKDSHAMAGIGCSYMAVWMNRETATSVQMGAEGANWNGIAPFSDMPHIFQNMGDGTYYHSGLLAIRAAVASGVSITYKILFNDAVAMTGGQPIDGPLTVPQISRQVSAEGVGKIVIVTDEPDKYSSDSEFAPGTTVHHRDELEAVQQELRSTKGTTVLIYDQTCAAEKRRRRKRREYPDPPKRVFINDAVCEGCGDCTVKSNCVSILPLETEFGRKRQIDQSACNKDFSCVDGFCPSFVTVHGGGLRKQEAPPEIDDLFCTLPDPELPSLDAPYTILITGIGGMGVVTIGAILGMAAHIEGKGSAIFDMTGLAQKNGAVMTHIHLAAKPSDIQSVRIGAGEAELLLGCDLVVSETSDALRTVKQGRTRAIINSHMTPTGDFQQNTDIDFQKESFVSAVREVVGTANIDCLDATTMALNLAGDTIATNMIMVGYAFQKGLLPVSGEAITRAIEVNGTAVEANKRYFNLGRLAADQPEMALGQSDAAPIDHGDNSSGNQLEHTLERCAAFLTEYQDAKYAEEYLAFVALVTAREDERVPNASGLSEAVALSLFKLMAYKDEYEVARLYTSGAFMEKLHTQFEGEFKLRFHLAPPLFAPRDRVSGEPRKLDFGPWLFPIFRLLAKLKRLRGTAFDVFGHTRERRAERKLIKDYLATISSLLSTLTLENHALAIKIAKLPEKMRGFGHVKEKNISNVKLEQSALLESYMHAERTPNENTTDVERI